MSTGIHFLRAERACSLRELLARDFRREQIDEWLHFGAVYVDGVRRREDIALAEGAIVRLHTRPKRYVTQADLASRVVFDHPEFLVLDKPAGLPVHPTLDNFLENAKYLLERELGRPMYITHRLDIPTRGLLVIAKSPEAQVILNRAFARGRVEKIYRARSSASVPAGPHTHYMDPKSRVPKTLSAEAVDGWWECRLEVLASDSGRHEIRLLTGKTHQIRAQLAFLGAPILGDAAYGSASEWPGPGIALECHTLGLQFRTERWSWSLRASSL